MRGCGLCRRFWESGRQRRYKGGEENTSSLAFTRPGEEDGKKCHQNDTVCSFFLMNSLIKKGTKKFLFPNQSSIFYLFNQALN
jgi:hypothetical protein